MTEIYQGDDVDEEIENMLAYVKTQVENPALPKSGFSIDHIMHLDIDFHELNLTRGSAYIELPAWIEKKKAVINPKNTKDEECFKWAVIAALHHEEIDKNPQRISKLKPFVDRYNWHGLEFPVSKDQIKKFEKKNLEIAVNVLFLHENGRKSEIDPSNVLGNEKEDEELKEALSKKGKIRTLRRSKFNTSRSKVVNLLMISDGKKNHYTCVKNMSRLLTRENTKCKNASIFAV